MESTLKIPTIDVKQYGGMQVAIVDGKVIASGKSLNDVVAQVRKVVPSRPLSEVKIFAVPKTLSVIYYVAPVSVRNHASRRRKARTLSCR